MLQLAGLDALAVDVGQLLDLERPLHARRVVEAAAHHQQGLGLVQLLGDLVDLLVLLQHFLDQRVEGPQAVNYLSAARLWKRRDEFVSKGNQLEFLLEQSIFSPPAIYTAVEIRISYVTSLKTVL